MIQQFIKSRKGSFTVEASLVFSAVFLTVMAVMYVCLLLYLQVDLQSLVDRAALKGTVLYGSMERDIYIGRNDKSMIGSDPYRNLFDLETKEKEETIVLYLKGLSRKIKVLTPMETEISTHIENYVVYKKLNVTIKESYWLPAGGLLRKLGLDEKWTIRASSSAVIHDPVELLRNTDFTVDLVQDLNEKSGGKVEVLQARLQEMIDKIKKFSD